MKHLFLLALLATAVLGQAWAQPKFNFSKEIHDFGEVVEGKMASYDYEYVNTGNAPLIISNVQASCGCTTPFWTKEPVMPGKKGTIKASFNSAGRPGPFNKSVTVTSNAAEGTKMLTFKGVVLAKGSMPAITDEMKAKSATISYDRTEVNLGKLEAGQSAVARFNVTNTGKSKLEIFDATSSGYNTSWAFSKPSLEPGEKGVLEITYKAASKAGEAKDVVQVASSDYNNYFTKLTLRATINEAAPASSLMRPNAAVPFK
jgi:hypothetical protein